MASIEETIEKNEKLIQGIVVFVLLVLGVSHFFPPLIDDTEYPQLVDPTTGTKVYQKKISLTSIFLYFVAVIIMIFIIYGDKEETKVSKIRSVIEVWNDIPNFELVKYALPGVEDLSFKTATILPTTDVFTRFVEIKTDKGILQLTIYVGDDLKSKYTTPVLTITRKELPTNVAYNLLNKKTRSIGETTRQLQNLGVPPDKLKSWVVEEQLRKDKLARNNAPQEGEQ